MEEHHFKSLMAILRKLDAGVRLSEEDAVWLKSEGDEYVSVEIMRAYHRLEADFFIAEYKRSGDVWSVVSASGHLRKCGASKEAHELLVAVPDAHLKQSKLMSAFRTTHGGVMRDLGRYDEAVSLDAAFCMWAGGNGRRSGEVRVRIAGVALECRLSETG